MHCSCREVVISSNLIFCLEFVGPVGAWRDWTIGP
jgi:hypothetical protein